MYGFLKWLLPFSIAYADGNDSQLKKNFDNSALLNFAITTK